MPTPSNDERLARLRLSRTDGIGPITYKRLLERFGSGTRAIEALPHMAARGGKKEGITPYPQSRAVEEIEKLRGIGGRFVIMGDDAYPALLATCEDAPPVLACVGNVDLLSKRCIAVVGARNASLAGLQMARTLAGDLGRAGLTIVSGLARGIDGAAHMASVDTGTIGVVAGGVDVIYPAENEKLHQDIAQRGLVIAESPMGVQPAAHLFPKRNRIIAGLTLGTVVVEATLKSGSLLTAHMAGDYGRDVFAVPGHPMEPRAAGPNSLIKDGAYMVRAADDVLQAIAAPRSVAQEDHDAYIGAPIPYEAAEGEADRIREPVFKLLSVEPVSIDTLQATLGCSPAALQVALLELELAGRIARYPGGRVARGV